MDNKQVRIVLWAIPCTVSTAFTISMSQLDDIQIIASPFRSAHRYSNGEICNHFEHSEEARMEYYKRIVDADANLENTCPFEDMSDLQVKQDVYEADYPGKKVVFVREMIYAIDGKFENIPKGYRHIFIIRDPKRVLASQENLHKKICMLMNDSKICSWRKSVASPKTIFKLALDLYDHLKKTGLDYDPVVIDADELLKNPEGILRKFCDRVQIDYTDKLVNWDSKCTDKNWKMSPMHRKEITVVGGSKYALESSGFLTPEDPIKPLPTKLSTDLSQCIDLNLPYYKKLYNLVL